MAAGDERVLTSSLSAERCPPPSRLRVQRDFASDGDKKKEAVEKRRKNEMESERERNVGREEEGETNEED